MSAFILATGDQAFAAEDQATPFSDEDVQILHDIISQAELSPGPQFGPGLFAAYDEILARQDVPSSREQKYFMFLLRMLTGRGENDTLYSRFQHVLASMGIQVERDGFPAEGTEDIASPISPTRLSFVDAIKGEDDERALYSHLLTKAESLVNTNLLRSTFTEWRQQSTNRHRFDLLTTRAVEFRHHLLMFKAFDHWRNAASDEVSKLATAERHMIRFHYFNDWRAVSLAQSFKIQQFQKSKFFTLWWQGRTRLRALEEAARSTYRSNLLRSSFRTWLMHYCDRRAPLWKAEKRTRQYFSTWCNQTRLQRVRTKYVDTIVWPHKLERAHLNQWRGRLEYLSNMETEADSFRKQSLLWRNLKAWRKSTILTPNISLFKSKQVSRAAYRAISLWRHQTIQSREATKFRDKNIIRRAFSAWNHALRSSYVIEDVDLRVQAEALYRWSLACRMSQAGRRLDTRLLRMSLLHWHSKTSEQKAVLKSLTDKFEATQCRVQLLSSLHRWGSVLHRYQQSDELALDFRCKKLAATHLQKWQARTQHAQHLDEQASAARFYISTKGTLKAWQERTREHLRLRRREAFAIVRRNRKIRLAHGTLQRMNDTVVNARAMDRIAAEKAEDRVLQTAMTMLVEWRDRLRSVQENRGHALTLSTQKLLARGLHTWSDRLHNIQTLVDAAVSFHLATVERGSSDCFRRLDRRRFQIKGQEHLAMQLRERQWQKRVKSMLRYWGDRAAALQEEKAKRMEIVGLTGGAEYEGDQEAPGIGANIGQSGSLQSHRDMLHEAHLHSRAFYPDRIPADPDTLGIDELAVESSTILTSTPLPGYLRTPSRRIGRAKARGKFASLDVTKSATRTLERVLTEAQIATAPAASSSFPSVRSGLASITPFKRKLLAQGYSGYARRGDLTTSDQVTRPIVAVTDRKELLEDFEDIEEDVESPGTALQD